MFLRPCCHKEKSIYPENQGASFPQQSERKVLLKVSIGVGNGQAQSNLENGKAREGGDQMHCCFPFLVREDRLWEKARVKRILQVHGMALVHQDSNKQVSTKVPREHKIQTR